MAISIVLSVGFIGALLGVLLVVIHARGRSNKRLAAKNHELGAALRQSEQKMKGLEVALQQAERKITGLEGQISSLRLTSTPKEPLSVAGAKISLALPPNGLEVFLPPLDPRRAYQITIWGTCAYSYWEKAGFFFKETKKASADALYYTDRSDGLFESHDWLELDGVSLRSLLKAAVAEAMPEEDREAHRYGLRIDGTEKKISASFRVQPAGRITQTENGVTLTIELLPEGTPSPLAAQRSKQEAKKNATRVAQLERLRSRVHKESHFLDAEFQEQFARRHMKTVLETWKQEWAREYDQFMHNAELKRLAAEQAPQVLDWFEARVKIVQLAERLMVTPPSLPPRKKMTADEVRARIIRRQGVRVDDGIALTKLKAEKIAEAKAMLNSLGLDPEERERLETELIQDILEAGEDENNSQGGTTL